MSGPTGGTWQSWWYPRPQETQILEASEAPQEEQERISSDSGSVKSLTESEFWRYQELWSGKGLPGKSRGL